MKTVPVLDVIDRATGEVVTTLSFFPSELELPGYLEHVEAGYEDTMWRTERRTVGDV